MQGLSLASFRQFVSPGGVSDRIDNDRHNIRSFLPLSLFTIQVNITLKVVINHRRLLKLTPLKLPVCLLQGVGFNMEMLLVVRCNIGRTPL